MPTVDSFGTRTVLTVGGQDHQIYSLPALQAAGFPEIARLPFDEILLKTLRHEEGVSQSRRRRGSARGDLKGAAQKKSLYGLPAAAQDSQVPQWSTWPQCATHRRGSVATPTKKHAAPVNRHRSSVQVDYFGANAFS